MRFRILYPDIHIHLDECTSSFVVPSDIMESLVLIGLSVTLHRLIYGSLPHNGFRLFDRLPAFIKTLEDINHVDRLYKLDISPSLEMISKDQMKSPLLNPLH